MERHSVVAQLDVQAINTIDKLNANRLTHHCMIYSASLCARNVFPVPLEPQRITRRCSVNSDM